MAKKYALRKVATGVMSVAIGAQLVASAVNAQDDANTENSSVSSEVSKNSISSSGETNSADESSHARDDKDAPLTADTVSVQDDANTENSAVGNDVSKNSLSSLDVTNSSDESSQVRNEKGAQKLKDELVSLGVAFEEIQEGEYKKYITQTDFGPATVSLMEPGAKIEIEMKQLGSSSIFGQRFSSYQEILDYFAREKQVIAEVKALGSKPEAIAGYGLMYSFVTATNPAYRVFYQVNNTTAEVTVYSYNGNELYDLIGNKDKLVAKFNSLSEYSAWLKNQTQPAESNSSSEEASTPVKKVVREEEAKKIKAELEAAGIPFEEKRTEIGDEIYVTYDIQNELGTVTVHSDHIFNFKNTTIGRREFKDLETYQAFLKSERFALEKKVVNELQAVGIKGTPVMGGVGYYFQTQTTPQYTVNVEFDPDVKPLVLDIIVSGPNDSRLKLNSLAEYTEWLKKQTQPTDSNSSTEETSKPAESNASSEETSKLAENNSSTEETSKPAENNASSEETSKPMDKPADKPMDKPTNKPADNSVTPPVHQTKAVEQAKPQAKQGVAKPQGKQLPNTGESQGVFAVIGISMMALAAAVAKKFKHNA